MKVDVAIPTTLLRPLSVVGLPSAVGYEEGGAGGTARFGGVYRRQDRQPQLGVVLDLDREPDAADERERRVRHSGYDRVNRLATKGR